MGGVERAGRGVARRRWVRRSSVAALLALTFTGCRASPGFACSDDSQCEHQAHGGQCFAIGACGYPDADCPGGYRYSPHAPAPWSNTCVVPDAEVESSTTTASTSLSSDSTGASTTSSEPDSSGEPPAPTCGDGHIDFGETCDDGNQAEGDGCNPDCRPSGEELFNFLSGEEGSDQAEAVLLVDDDDDMLIAGRRGGRGFVERWATDGTISWSFPADDDVTVDIVNDLIYAGGTLRALGSVTAPADKMDEEPPQPDLWLAELDPDNGTSAWTSTHGAAAPSAELGNALTTVDDDIVVSARIGSVTTPNFGVFRFSPADSQLNVVWNRVFGDGEGHRGVGNAVAWNGNAGRIFVGGAIDEGSGFNRYFHTFDADGVEVCSDIGIDAGDDRILDVAISPLGHVVAVGFTTRDPEEGRDAWIGLYPAAPGCDLAWVVTEFGPGHKNDAFTSVAIDGLNNIVVGGYVNVGNNEDAWLGKYDTNGNQMWVVGPLDGSGSDDDRVTDIAIGPKREITVVGRWARPDDVDVWVARYTP